MIGENLKDAVRLMGKARLYARVGLKGMTPLKAYRMLRYWILTVVFKKEIPWLVEFSVTYRCQCRCKHCSVSNYFAGANTGKRDELTTDQINDVLDQAVKMGIPKVDLFGGEPLLRKDVIDLVRYGARKGLYISLTTNALLLTRDMTRRLKEAGISCINVSLDSINGKEHDEGRGVPGIFEKAVNGIGYCHEEGVTCIASTYITRDGIRNFGSEKSDDSQLRRMIDFAKERKVSGLRVLFPIISGEWVDTKDVALSEEEKREVIDAIDPSFVFIEGAYCVKNKKKICQALSRKIINISPYGDMQLCIAFPDTFGNVVETSLEDSIRSMWNHPIYLKNKDGDCCSTHALKR